MNMKSDFFLIWIMLIKEICTEAVLRMNLDLKDSLADKNFITSLSGIADL